MEHTSHHPPIDNFLIDAANYEIRGHYELCGSFSVLNNSLIGGLRGRSHVIFRDGQIV